VTASQDGVARVWRETGVEELLRLAHQRVRRRITPDERRRFGLLERDDDAPLLPRGRPARSGLNNDSRGGQRRLD
jgi:hypothetical protein